MNSVQFSSYKIHMAAGLLQSEELLNLCVKLRRRIAIITDNHLVAEYASPLQHNLRQKGLSVEILTFPAGEQSKTRATKEQLEDELQRKHYGRDSCLLALGGGLVTDLVGFLAATYCRGVPVIYLPTTLLAMVDASMGGKTGVNTPLGKNLIGTFTQPYAVCMDLNTLQTLADCEWRNGIAEMVKHALIVDADLYQQMQGSESLQAFKNRKDLLELIKKNCLIKKNIVEQDEHEYHLRQLLNFGHTIGHAIETIENYQIGHGEAVAIGMLVECHLAMQKGYLPQAFLDQLQALLQRYGLPLKTKAFQDQALFKQTLSLDKKSLHSLPHFVLLQDIGQAYVKDGRYTHPVEEEQLNKSIEWAFSKFRFE